MKKAEVQRAVAALVFITFLWGVSFPLVKASNLLMTANQMRALGIEAAQSAPFKFDLDLQAAALTILLRFGLSFVLVMLMFGRQFRGLTPRQWLMGGGVGVVFAVAVIGQIIALNDISASRSAFLTSLTVIFTPLLLVAWTGRRPALHVVLAVLVALFGVAVLTEMVVLGPGFSVRLSAEFQEKVGLGDLLTILAAALFAAEIIMIDVFSRHMPPALLTPGMFAAIFLIGALLFGLDQLAWSAAPSLASWGRLFATPAFPLLGLVIILGCTIVPFHFMNKYQAKVTPNQAALIYTLEPVFTTLWALFLPGVLSPLLAVDYPSEKLNSALVVGGALVVGANIFGFWMPNPRAAADERIIRTETAVMAKKEEHA